MDNTCTCGDVYDEHEDGGPCLVCEDCVHFEADDDEETGVEADDDEGTGVEESSCDPF